MKKLRPNPAPIASTGWTVPYSSHSSEKIQQENYSAIEFAEFRYFRRDSMLGKINPRGPASPEAGRQTWRPTETP